MARDHVAEFANLFSRMFRPLFRESDDVETRVRKTVFAMYVIMTLILAGIIFAEHTSLMRSSPFLILSGAFNAATGLTCIVMACITKKMTRRFVGTVCFIHFALILLADIHQASMQDGRALPLVVLVLDMLLVFKVGSAAKIVVVGAILWATLLFLEGLLRFGVYDLPGLISYDVRQETMCSCEHPPCTGNLARHWKGYAVLLSTLLMDFFITRRFADLAHSEQRRAKLTIRIAQKISAALASFDLDEAKAHLAGDAKTQLEPELYSALSAILVNLQSYRPYLPHAAVIKRNASQAAANAPTMAPLYSGPAPAGSRVAIVFTDICRSTMLWEGYPRFMKKALVVHDRIVRVGLSIYKGYEVKTIGDSFMAAFAGPRAACCFGVQMQCDLEVASWPPITLSQGRRRSNTDDDMVSATSSQCDERTWTASSTEHLEVRVGINWGECERQQNHVTSRYDYFGRAVNKAARVQSVGLGGWVIVTEDVMRDVHMAVDLPDYEAIEYPVPVILNGIAEATQLTCIFSKDSPDKLLEAEALFAQIEISPEPLPASEVTDILKTRASRRPGGDAFNSSCHATHRARDISSVGISEREKGSHCSAGSVIGLFSPSRSPHSARSVIPSASVMTIHMALNSTGDGDVVTDAEDFIGRVLARLERTKGVIGSVQGSWINASWNTVSTCGPHVENALHFLALFRRDAALVVGSRTGLACGPVTVGEVGVTQRFVITLGPTVGLSKCLCAAAAEMDVAVLCASGGPDRFDTYLHMRKFLRPLLLWRRPAGHTPAARRFTSAGGDTPRERASSTSVAGEPCYTAAPSESSTLAPTPTSGSPSIVVYQLLVDEMHTDMKPSGPALQNEWLDECMSALTSQDVSRLRVLDPHDRVVQRMADMIVSGAQPAGYTMLLDLYPAVFGNVGDSLTSTPMARQQLVSSRPGSVAELRL